MANININRSVQDPFYRYKMPKLLAKVEGSGNGIKTVVPNMVDIAKALARPPAYPTKFFGYELGAQVQMDEKTERYIVNGNHTQEKLQDLLFSFIEKFVLCRSCDNPETSLKVTKKKTIEQSCVACGHHQALITDQKFASYIISHPPPDVAETGKTAKEKKKKDDGTSIDIGQASVRANAAERANGAVAAPVPEDDGDDDVDWGEDVSEEAVRARQAAALSGAAAAMTMTADLDRPVEERLEMFQTFVKARTSLPKFPAKEVLAEADRLECREKAILVLIEVLLDNENPIAAIDTHKALFAAVVGDSSKSQKYALGGWEHIVGQRPELVAKTLAALKRFYEYDIVDEEVILAWSEKGSKKYVSKDLNQKIRDAAAPFCKWLREAEAQSSDEDEQAGGDDDEEDDDVAVVYDTSAGPGIAQPDLAAARAKEIADDDDLDIDAI